MSPTMAWPIPEIPEPKIISVPRYGFWITLLILMLIAGAAISLWVWNVATYANVFFYGILPTLFIWLCIFGVIVNRYEQFVTASRAWNLEAELTKAEWSRWSRRQIAVVGNVLFSPEENGMDALLGESEKVPAYPKKARPLFNSPHDFPALLHETDMKLEHQYPGYRHFLHSISVFHSSDRFDEYRNESIYQQWDLIPTAFSSIEALKSLHNTKMADGLMLIICLQDWPDRSVKQSSEFISAQLITTPLFARQHALSVIAGITRMMPLEEGNLMNELDMLFEYTQPDRENLKYIWLQGAAEKTSVEIMQYAARHQWQLPEKRPLHSIDFSFGPPGEMALPLALAMLAEAANRLGKDQLLVNQTPQQTGMLCLITRDLYV